MNYALRSPDQRLLFIDRRPTHDVRNNCVNAGRSRPEFVTGLETGRKVSVLSAATACSPASSASGAASASVLLDERHTGDAVIPPGAGAGNVHQKRSGPRSVSSATVRWRPSVRG